MLKLKKYWKWINWQENASHRIFCARNVSCLLIFLSIVTLLLITSPIGSLGGAEREDSDGSTPEVAQISLDNDFAAPPLPTLGGLQLWQDSAYYAGWRIQRHVWTEHYRLLDPNDLRYIWGDEVEVLEEFAKIKADPTVRPLSDHLVILLHGWGRTSGMFDEMHEALEDAGYDVLSFTYPSTRASIADHATALRQVLKNLEGTRRVSFVTHSLGGIVLRKMLADDPKFAKKIELHRAVLIAAPNQGAAIAEALVDFAPFHWVGGPVASDLTDEDLQKLPPPSIPFLVIAGALGDGEGWNPLLEGDDDGVVTLAETYLEGAENHLHIQEIHTFIANHPQTIEATLNFLSQSP